jgi:hypothetical protein
MVQESRLATVRSISREYLWGAITPSATASALLPPTPRDVAVDVSDSRLALFGLYESVDPRGRAFSRGSWEPDRLGF